MRDATRRNRNIGTAKQGHGQSNKLTIAQPCGVLKHFYERLDKYTKTERIINGHEFIFIVEQLRETSKHSCSIEDIATIIQQIPESDYGELKFIVMRQPKRKEETLSLTWGRLVYVYEFEDEYFPAVIIDAVDFTKRFKWTNKLSIEQQKELERLKNDGHEIINDGRHFTAEYKQENVRNTQLYRTLPHEFGHYVQYLETVTRPTTEDEDFEEYEKRQDLYFKIPSVEKEKFAHNYAEKLVTELKTRNIIPFEMK
ncbi:MAG: hypothetical protein H6Q14_2166 [Bacteroidetes bacterium]|nr:hypothetical protein [Bacteroidota bacterium]